MSEKKKSQTGKKPEVKYDFHSPDSCVTKLVKMYVSSSFLRFLLRRLGRIQKTKKSSEVENKLTYRERQARQFSKIALNKRVRLYRVCIVFLIFLWLFLMYGVAIGMVLTGVFQTSLCTFDNGFIIIYLIVGGVMTIVFVVMRLMLCSSQVCLSCYKDKNPGTIFAYTMCLFEFMNIVIFLTMICWLAAGIYFTFARGPSQSSTSGDHFCEPSVLIPTYIFLIAQILLIPWTIVTVGIICCGPKRMCCLYDEDEILITPQRNRSAKSRTESTNEPPAKADTENANTNVENSTNESIDKTED